MTIVYIPDATETVSFSNVLLAPNATFESLASIFNSHINDLNDYLSLIQEGLGQLNLIQSKSFSLFAEQIYTELILGTGQLKNILKDVIVKLTILQNISAEIALHAKFLLIRVTEELEKIRFSSTKMRETLGALETTLFQETTSEIYIHGWLPQTWDEMPIASLPFLESNLLTIDNAYTFENTLRAQWQFEANEWSNALTNISWIQQEWEELLTERQKAENQFAAFLQDAATTIQTTTKTISLNSRLNFSPIFLESRHQMSIPKNLLLDSMFVNLLQKGSGSSASYRTRNIASRKSLDFALLYPEKAHEILGFSGSKYSVEQFIKETKALKTTLEDAELSMKEIPINGVPILLLDFGNHDDSLTATISLGDLDTATNIGLAVSGMTSTVGNMQQTMPGVMNVLKQSAATVPPKELAVVHWIGYDSPGAAWHGDLSVFNSKKASSGAVELAEFIDQIYLHESRNKTEKPLNLTLFAHSYGSTTAAEALKISQFGVTNFIAIGSAGFVDGTDISELNAKNVYATTANLDKVAPFGVLVSGRSDPRSLSGVEVFEAENYLQTKPVTGHSLYLNSVLRNGYLSENTSSLQKVSSVVADVEFSENNYIFMDSNE